MIMRLNVASVALATTVHANIHPMGVTKERLSTEDLRELEEFYAQEETPPELRLMDCEDSQCKVYEQESDMNAPLPAHLREAINFQVNRKKVKAAYKRNLGKQMQNSVNMQLEKAYERAEGRRGHSF